MASRCKLFFITILFGTVIYLSYLWVFTADNLSSRRTQVCTNARVLTVRPMGNLGNSIWEYMSLYVVSKNYEDLRVTPYVQEEMKRQLESVFESISIKSRDDLTEMMDSAFAIPANKSLDVLDLNYNCSHLLLGNYSARYEDIVKFNVDNIRKELRFKENLVTRAMRTLNAIRTQFKLSGKEVTFVGMHYRGTDYIDHLRSNYGDKFKGPPDYRYYMKAMQYFKSRYRHVVFILISVDYHWLRKNRKFIEQSNRVKVNPNLEDPIRDLVLLSHCNHSIISYGTFGATAAFFNNGTTFVHNLELPLDYRGQTVAMGIAGMLRDKWHMLPCYSNCTVQI